MPRPQVMNRKCGTCIFRAHNPMDLAPGRFAEVIAENRQKGTALICHETIHGEHPEIGETLCRGFYDAYRDESPVISAMERLYGPDVFQKVEPPTA